MSNRRFAEHMLILKQNEGAEKEDILYLSLDVVNPGLRIASSDLWTWNDCTSFHYICMTVTGWWHNDHSSSQDSAAGYSR